MVFINTLRAMHAGAADTSTAATDWSALTPHQRLALLDLMKSTVQAELDKSVAEMNAMLAEQGCPAEIDIVVRLRLDPNRDPRLER